ncbi:Enoyl-CoA hydratase/carnithine racemase [Devosia lucknowensis]|uniref:Enoyl-CoA hydratase/carnithine racemase n=1 Tax=Devosia lucknowensis TaxID=1096929 RepID=A0A1Y6G6C7_9HYPH|nr:enoyl-CoA hydratase-related protein [Devosia lucknowensis]SMQ85695.1 Enoyl-CoA hydratase/carnithine racemase [Devosia lucknowensis]
MTGSSGLVVTRKDGVVTIVLDHSERANALDPAEFHALGGLLADLYGEPNLVAVVLTGRGDRFFCAGLNLRNEAAIQADLTSNGPTGLSAALRAAGRLPVPLIGRINGACVAGGMGLLGACDHVIAVDKARFGLPEVRHGIYPHVALAGLHDRGAATVIRRLADTGALIDAGAALVASLVDEIVAPEKLDDAVAQMVSRIRNGEPLRSYARRRAEGGAARTQRLDAADAAARLGQIKIVNS